MAKSIACSRLKIRAFVLSWEADEAWNRAWAARLPKRCATTKARCEMIIFDEDRPSDSPFVERVWRCHSEGAAPFLSIAASRCELVVSRLHGKVTLTVRGARDQSHATGRLSRGRGVAWHPPEARYVSVASARQNAG